MDYEKKYKEALAHAREIHRNEDEKRRDMEFIFPELKESEDERIRKALLELVHDTTGDELWIDYNVHKEDAIAWLEKHGGIDNCPLECSTNTVMTDSKKNQVEPKFKVGDWVIDKQDIVHQIANVIENVTNHTYGYDIVGGGYFNDNTEGVRLWTIQDAKDGDVLAGKIDGDNYILIFKQIKDGWVETYGHYYDSVDRFCVPSQLFCRDYQGSFIPATKEQRDLLFSKIKEAGYEWNAEKKELKKISQRMVSAEAKEAMYDKPDWSEEDERILDALVTSLNNEHFTGRLETLKGIGVSLVIDWLKSLKSRIERQ